MGRHDWYRRTSWTSEDQGGFQARLKRSRGDYNRAQYLRIQAHYLAEAGKHAAAIGLLDQLFAEYPHPSQLAQSHLQRAESLLALNRAEEAIAEYRTCVQAQRDYPTMQTGGALDFAWLIAARGLEHLYDDALSLVDECAASGRMLFPVERFRVAVVRALIADARGEGRAAKRHADTALRAAGTTHSGFRYHANLGLVGKIEPALRNRLAAIGGSI